MRECVTVAMMDEWRFQLQCSGGGYCFSGHYYHCLYILLCYIINKSFLINDMVF